MLVNEKSECMFLSCQELDTKVYNVSIWFLSTSKIVITYSQTKIGRLYKPIFSVSIRIIFSNLLIINPITSLLQSCSARLSYKLFPFASSSNLS